MSSISKNASADLEKSPESAKRRNDYKKLRRRNTLTFWSFVGPMALGLLVFVGIPIVWGIVLSFGNAQTTITPTKFVGLSNYIQVLSDPQFRSSMILVAIFAIIIVPLTLAFSLGLALLVNEVKFGRGFFRTVFFIPTACSYVVASAIWKMSLFNGTSSGFMNTILGWFGVEPIQWISASTPPWYWLVLVTVRLWLQVGLYMILFTAGLQDIPPEVYEAGRIDGIRNKFQELRYITLPLLKNTTISVSLLCLIGAFQAFDEFYNVLGSASGSGSGNLSLAMPPLVYLYNMAFSSQNYGVGSAGAFILTIVIVIFALLQGKLTGSKK
ncbi:MAG: sugar ABC transporter permease [Bifidobacteriaceae bacterium]|nr:sugar ABC transporter permease [Bifidobacteriaceae bacterium]MCI1979465.1 sugar ABC transporter permease [Bifidobacteriaceae bacterium]